jgi:hypothetical protein
VIHDGNLFGAAFYARCPLRNSVTAFDHGYSSARARACRRRSVSGRAASVRTAAE